MRYLPVRMRGQAWRRPQVRGRQSCCSWRGARRFVLLLELFDNAVVVRAAEAEGRHSVAARVDGDGRVLDGSVVAQLGRLLDVDGGGEDFVLEGEDDLPYLGWSTWVNCHIRTGLVLEARMTCRIWRGAPFEWRERWRERWRGLWGGRWEGCGEGGEERLHAVPWEERAALCGGALLAVEMRATLCCGVFWVDRQLAGAHGG